MQLQIGDCTYTLVTTPRQDHWTAYATRNGGERYGIEVVAATQADASSRLARWLTWQHEHTAALDALQQAEKSYHRAVAGSAFASAETQAAEARPARLALDVARNTLDDVRARRPNV